MLKGEILIYILIAISIIISLSGGGFLISMAAILAAFVAVGKVKKVNQARAKELLVVIIIGFAVLIVSFVAMFLNSA